MTATEAGLLFLAGLLAGGLNALAGGGAFITFPALLGTGVPPILANTTGTVAVWPGVFASLYAYRGRLRARHHPVARWLVLASLGSVSGAFLLLLTTNRSFLLLLPWLMLFATSLFVFGREITARIGRLRGSEGPIPPWAAQLLVLVIAVYGGYFGGGMGIMTLAVLTLLGMEDIHEMNALKSLLIFVINGAGVLTFALRGMIAWAECAAMIAGAVIGGYSAGRVVLLVEPGKVRRAVVVFAACLTVYFFFKAYWPGAGT
jgi:uncharacterized membrane protein YfcA